MSGFSCERAASSMLESRALSSAYLVLCGAWCLDSGTHVLSFGSCWGSDTRAPFSVIVWVRGLGFARDRTLLSTCVLLCCTHFMLSLVLCGTQLVYIYWLRAFMLSCVNTWLMSFLISCVFMSCFAHGWWFVCWPCACVFVLCEHMASVLVFCVPRALMSICLDPTHLVTCLLINFPQLFSLVTLLICSLYNLLVFAVPCGFVTLC